MTEAELTTYLETHHEDCFLWAMSCCHQDVEEARDLLHTVYLKILEGKASFKQKSSFKTWIFSMIRNRAIDRYRKNQRRIKRIRSFSSQAFEPGPELHMIRNESHSLLRRALNILTDKQHQVVHLVYFDEISVAEAAEIMNISVSTARTHLERAKKKLKKILHLEKLTA
ncbi:MAG: sigma-70 family RNA polymerase sigma factor [Bacteroidota bacterium]